MSGNALVLAPTDAAKLDREIKLVADRADPLQEVMP